jgi:hypothetical protein
MKNPKGVALPDRSTWTGTLGFVVESDDIVRSVVQRGIALELPDLVATLNKRDVSALI